MAETAELCKGLADELVTVRDWILHRDPTIRKDQAAAAVNAVIRRLRSLGRELNETRSPHHAAGARSGDGPAAGVGP